MINFVKPVLKLEQKVPGKWENAYLTVKNTKPLGGSQIPCQIGTSLNLLHAVGKFPWPPSDGSAGVQLNGENRGAKGLIYPNNRVIPHLGNPGSVTACGCPSLSRNN